MSKFGFVLPVVLIGALAMTTACSAASQEEKDIVLKEVAARGFTDVTIAPDAGMDGAVFVYATYKGCRLRLVVVNGQIGYPGVGNDVSPAFLDVLPAFQPCRDAVAGAQPGR